ncbi:hypothetical protein [Vannielia litorea]|uniref:hypothetical protein n=1 Tax=Vannielia litorea TaxID=1217970 RepID=UPI001C975891|nr:hypothetical protein [Vannielia litorea]MBY6049926.1 hypothetical protein [Vannielia litorea]MBY6077340.1 hypothetical protein [Vannielia litorea]
MADETQQLSDMIIAVLSTNAAQRIHFSYATGHVTGQGFGKVVGALVEGKITPVYAPQLGTEKAFYDPGGNAFYLGFKSLGARSGLLEGLILHESVHALFDIERLHMYVEQSEAAAYVAQALYVHGLNAAAYDAGAPCPFTEGPPIAAWEVIRGRAGKCFELTDADCSGLVQAMKDEPKMDYKHRFGTVESYDGV